MCGPVHGRCENVPGLPQPSVGLLSPSRREHVSAPDSEHLQTLKNVQGNRCMNMNTSMGKGTISTKDY